ncbi:MAG TPA: FHA domain-containing protein [Bacteriovoracaceae bacterium]|nr:FHA domain-containing protein [Bacteriovoracaceae bacterium]
MILLYHVNSFEYIELKHEFMIGRHTGDLIIQESFFSGKHAKFLFERTPEGIDLFIVDLNSKNRSMVNRVEIIPELKVRLYDKSFIQFGTHSFIVTTTKRLSLEEINNIISSNMSKNIIKLEGVMKVHEGKEKIRDEVSKLMDVEALMKAEMVEKERIILTKEEDILVVEQNLQKEFKKLDDTKARLILASEARKEGIANEIKEMRLEIDNYQKKLEEIDTEVELKKKKMSNIKVPGTE